MAPFDCAQGRLLSGGLTRSVRARMRTSFSKACLATFMPSQNPVPDNKTPGKASGFQSLVQAEKLMQIAFVLPSAMIVGWLGGAWADSKLHQSWMTIVGVILGCVAGLYYVIRLAIDAEKSAGASDSAKKRDDGSGTPP
jgi:F0F1-type ATP synthase assembly protein I